MGFLILGILIGAIVLYFILLPRLKAVQVFDESIALQNENMSKENNQLRNDLLNLTKEHSSLIAKKEEILASISSLQKQAEDASNFLYEKSYQLANEKMSYAAESMSKKYRDLKENVEKDYLKMLKEASTDFNNQICAKKEELNQIKDQLKSILIQIKAGTEALDRQKMIQESPEDYSLNLSLDALEDIKKLFVIKKELHNPRVLLMLIWSNFIKTPLDSLCDKTFGKNETCGIYKITNLITNEIYIGQSIQCKERMHQHYKKGLGIDAPNNNKLYNNMQQYGVWNFSIELLEICPREQLNEKEKYYIALYQSNYSLNSTSGNNT